LRPRRRVVVIAVVCAALAGALLALLTPPKSHAQTVAVVATRLNVPWELAFLPDGRALVTERGGRLLVLARGLRSRRSVGRIATSPDGEGGLLGLAIDPGFARNRLVYAYRKLGGENHVVRFRFTGNRIRSARVIVRGIRAGGIHDGGRLAFGPDGALYITTGETGQGSLSQDPQSLNGKVLRLRGGLARGAGGRPEIVSLGHRNVQGLDWQPGSDRLVVTELGAEDRDEVNVIREGGNYGWPSARGGDTGGGRFIGAAWDTGRGNIAPSGGTFVTARNAWTGDFVFGALGGEQVRKLSFSGAAVTGDRTLFTRRFGRIRTVVEGPDRRLYLVTSNRDGRGSPTRSDDRIIRVTPPR
jgi:glucose/arabinose dehydrogenase